MRKAKKQLKILKWVNNRRKKQRRLVLWRRIGIAAHVVVWIALISIVAQLLYPSDRSLPGAYVGDKAVGVTTKAELMSQLDQIAAGATLRIETPDKQRQVSWASIGATIDREATAELVVNYAWWERLVPLSLAARSSVTPHYEPLVIVDPNRLTAFAEKIALEDRRAAKEASITFVDGEVVVDQAKAGYVFSVESIMQQILASEFKDGAVVTLTPKVLPTVHETLAVERTARQAREILDRPVELAFAGKKFTPAKAEVGRWLKVVDDPETLQLNLSADTANLEAYLNKINQTHATPPADEVVTLLDGKEVGRTRSEPGRAMNVETAAARLARAIETADGEAVKVGLPVERIEPGVSYRRTYSQTNNGLGQIIRDWEAATYGDFGVVVREIGGSGRYADWQPDKQFVTASTYKMFLAYVVLKEMQEGDVSGGQMTDMGWTVDACLTEMIVNSTNPCAIALQNLVGWEHTDDVLRAAGFSSTTLNNSAGVVEKTTTVRDEADFLLRLHGGALLDAEHSERLLGLMRRQVWRAGIPAGVPYGTVVENKVGFYNAWVHDVAIVHSPGATYILAVMSKGGSDPGFADLSKRIYSFFNQ